MHAASPALQRVVDAAYSSGYVQPAIIAEAEKRCETALCFARELALRLPERVRLERIAHPDTDTIRWVRTARSVDAAAGSGGGAEGLLRIRMPRFGRKAIGELRTLLESNAGTKDGQRVEFEVDLRGNSGGDFKRMLALAGLLIGPKPDVVEMRRHQVSEHLRLSGPETRHWMVRNVLIDQKTASAALMLARILVTQGGAELIGRDQKPEMIFLKRRVTVAHDWRLVLPIAQISCIGN